MNLQLKFGLPKAEVMNKNGNLYTQEALDDLNAQINEKGYGFVSEHIVKEYIDRDNQAVDAFRRYRDVLNTKETNETV